MVKVLNELAIFYTAKIITRTQIYRVYRSRYEHAISFDCKIKSKLSVVFRLCVSVYITCFPPMSLLGG